VRFVATEIFRGSKGATEANSPFEGAILRDIKDAALTIADGMAVTFSHLVRKPYTVQYPDPLPAGVRVQDTLPFR